MFNYKDLLKDKIFTTYTCDICGDHNGFLYHHKDDCFLEKDDCLCKYNNKCLKYNVIHEKSVIGYLSFFNTTHTKKQFLQNLHKYIIFCGDYHGDSDYFDDDNIGFDYYTEHFTRGKKDLLLEKEYLS